MSKATLTGPLAAVLLFGGLFENNIETSKPDAPIRAWLSTTGNAAWIAHATALAVGGVVLMIFAQVLRARLSAVDDVLTRMVGALGTVLGTILVVGAAIFAAVPIGRFFERAPAPDPSTYRFLMAAAASLLVIFLSVPAAALAGAVGVQVLRGTSTAPRWLGYVGIVGGILTLVSAFVAPLAVFCLWLVVTGIGLAATRAPVPSARVAPAHA